ncbi:MAG TPA: hypothetical protein VFI41_04995 [Gemmatimonadales bacterium]|nr:hypothetical protein [Gemmatimonadales bacterium]
MTWDEVKGFLDHIRTTCMDERQMWKERARKAERLYEFAAWLEFGAKQGWCSEPFCTTHGLQPQTPEEEAAWDEGDDPCAHAVRLWPQQ